MNNRWTASIAVLLGFLLFSTATPAHHGLAAYDMDKTIALKGTVTNFEFTNPHSIIYWDVKDDEGVVQHWVAETHNPRVLGEAGWTKDTIKPGDEVTIYVHAARNGLHVGDLVKVVFADGRELDPKTQPAKSTN